MADRFFQICMLLVLRLVRLRKDFHSKVVRKRENLARGNF